MLKVEFEGEVKEVSFSGSAAELLKKLNINREEVVLKVNGKIAPEDVSLKGDEEIEIIRVVFGG